MITRWTWLWRVLGRHLWLRRTLLTLAIGWLVMISVGASVCLADDISGKSAGDPLITWMSLTDSHGVPIYAYQISGPKEPTGLDALNPIPKTAIMWHALAEMSFTGYRTITAYAIWGIDWIASFEWFQMLNEPAMQLSGRFSMMLDQINVMPAFMAITALVAFLLWASGRGASAVYELVACWIIASLTVGMLANPTSSVGGDEGLIMQTRNTGLEMAGAMTAPVQGDVVLGTDGQVVQEPNIDTTTDTNQLQSQLTSRLIDVFVRQPAQLINYGKVLDKTGCEGAFNDITKDGPYSDSSIPMDKITECDDEAGGFAANPSSSQSMAALALSPAGLAILFLAVLIAGGIVSAVGWALYSAVKMLWSNLQALLPGGNKDSLAMDIAEIMVNLALLWFSVFILAIYQVLVTGIFNEADSEALPKTFIQADILLILLVWIYKRQKDKIHQQAERIGRFLSKRPQGNSFKSPVRPHWNPVKTMAGAVAGTTMLMRRRRTPAVAASHTFAPTQINFFGGQGAEEQQESPRSRVTVTQVDPEPHSSPARRLAMLTGKTAGRALLGHATGGASTILLAANRARRLALDTSQRDSQRREIEGRLRPRALPSAPTRPQLGPGPASGNQNPRSGDASRPGRPNRPRPSGGGLFGWMRNLRSAGSTKSAADGYRRIRTRDGVVLVPSTPASGPSSGGGRSAASAAWLRRRRRRGDSR